jgi:hypothetical protein
MIVDAILVPNNIAVSTIVREVLVAGIMSQVHWAHKVVNTNC